jgi:hypothetical protein
MTMSKFTRQDPRIPAALLALQQAIQRRFPAAHFQWTAGDDPEGIYLRPIIDIDDLDDVFDQELMDALFRFQAEDGLPVWVFPRWPEERLARELSAARSRRPVGAPPLEEPA